MELPKPPPGETVQLRSGWLVYAYENSVVQPFYLFEGETQNGTGTEYFVKAAVYGK
jgi:hypothetical protein